MATPNTGSNAGVYFLATHDSQRDEWLVVGVFVAGDYSWVAGRFDTRKAAEASAGEWMALEEAAA